MNLEWSALAETGTLTDFSDTWKNELNSEMTLVQNGNDLSVTWKDHAAVRQDGEVQPLEFRSRLHSLGATPIPSRSNSAVVALFDTSESILLPRGRRAAFGSF